MRAKALMGAIGILWLAVAASASDLCSFKPSAGAQRIVDMRNVFNMLRLFADTSASHTSPLVPAENASTFDPVAGLDGIEDTVCLRLLVHPSGMVLDGKAKKPGHHLMSECLAYQWAAGAKLVPASRTGEPCASWKSVDVFVHYLPENVEVYAVEESPEVIVDHPANACRHASRERPMESVRIDELAEMEYCATPEYPRAARMAGQQGTVLIRALVDSTGSVDTAYVQISCGHKLIDEAALAVAPKNKFKPALCDGNPIRTWVSYKVSY